MLPFPSVSVVKSGGGNALVSFPVGEIVHRDIKPSNVLVCQEEVKLLDFGIAVKAKAKAALAGTVEYLAPELLLGEPPSVASDLYSVGILAHQMLTGRFPYGQDSMTEILQSILGTRTDLTLPPTAMRLVQKYKSKPAGRKDALQVQRELGVTPEDLAADTWRTEVPGPLGGVIRKLVSKTPQDRYPNAQSVLRGLAAAMEIELPIETVSTRESFLQATVLVGREAELSLLQDHLDRSKRGQGGTLLIGGESGAGKSRLLSELRTLALVHGLWVIEGQSIMEGGGYYQEWLPLLRALCMRVDTLDTEAAVLKPIVPDISELLGRPIPDPPAVKAEEMPRRLLATVHGLLGRSSKPALLILEDLHWGRSESIALLDEVSKAVTALPVMLVGTYRTDERPDLPGCLPAMAPLTLNRLGPVQIAELSESMLGEVGRRRELVSYLEHQTEGNVFFLIEVVRALAEKVGELNRIGEGELPEQVLTEGMGRIVERRVQKLPVEYRPLLQFAALLGRKLDLLVLAHAFPEAPLRSLLIIYANAAVLESQGSDWRFAHDKLREAILHQIPHERRPLQHRQVAESLEAVYSGEQRAKFSGLLAYHFAQAGLPERALAYSLQAADAAVRLCLYAEARAELSGALSALAQLEDTPDRRRLRVDLLLRQVQTALLTDKLDAQIERTSAAQKLIDSLAGADGLPREDRLRQARLHYYLGRAYHYAGQPGEAIKRYQLVLPVAQECGDQELLVLPAYVTGIALCMQGNSAEGCNLLRQAVGPMEGLGNVFEWLRGILFYGLTLSATGRYREGLEQMNQAFIHAQRIGQHSVVAMCQLMFSAVRRTGADWPATAAAGRMTVEHALQSGDKVYLFAGWSYLAWAKSYLGEHEAADEQRSRALAVAKEMGGRMIISDWFEAADGERALLGGQPALALTRAQALVKKAEPAGLVLSHGLAERVWGCALARLGESEAEVDTHFQESIRVLRSGNNLLDIAHTEAWWGRVYLERGARDLAREHLLAAHAQYQRSELDVAGAEVEKLLRTL